MMPQERAEFKGTNATVTIHQNRTRLTITLLKAKIGNRLTIDMKRTKWYITKLHIQPISSAHSPLENVNLITRKRQMPQTVRIADTNNQILRLTNLEMHGKQRIGEGLVYEKMSRMTNVITRIKLEVVLPPREALS
jgi:predicted nucleotide-binding protein (sugar kinase/HSP70/actin superfamily)